MMRAADRKAPRLKGDARRPLLTRRVLAGFATLPHVVTSSQLMTHPELAAALAYVAKLAAYESRPEAKRQRAEAAALSKRWREHNEAAPV